MQVCFFLVFFFSFLKKECFLVKHFDCAVRERAGLPEVALLHLRKALALCIYFQPILEVAWYEQNLSLAYNQLALTALCISVLGLP